jgi:hypothetical protein
MNVVLWIVQVLLAVAILIHGWMMLAVLVAYGRFTGVS